MSETMKKNIKEDKQIDLTHVVGEAGSVVVSTMFMEYIGYETLVFEADRSGKVKDWNELSGRRYDTLAEAKKGHEKIVKRYMQHL
jgi:hypothetical protein